MTTRRRHVEPIDTLLLFRLAVLDDGAFALADDVDRVRDLLSVQAVEATVRAAMEKYDGDVRLFEEAAARGRIDPVWAQVARVAYVDLQNNPNK